jgi:L-amino acid N-acyltransferase
MLEYTIRKATKGDLPQIMAMYNHAIAHTTAVYEYEPFDHQYMEAWWVVKQEGNWPILVFEKQGNEIIAFGTFGSFRARAAYISCVEHSLYVKENFQGHGLGKRMLECLIDKAKEEGKHSLIGGVDSSNAKSIDLHLQLGFTEVGRLPEVAYKFNRWLDLVFLQRII